MRESTIATEIEDSLMLIGSVDIHVIRIVVSAHGYRELLRDAKYDQFERVYANAPDVFMGKPVLVDNFQKERWTIVCGGPL